MQIFFSSNFTAGDTVTGSWTIDTTSPVNSTSLSYMKYYDTSFNASIGAHDFSGAAEYRIFDDSPSAGDGFSIINEKSSYSVPSALAGLEAKTFFLQFMDMPITTLTGFSQITNPDSIFSLSNPSYAPHGLRLNSTTDDSHGLLYFSVDEISTVSTSVSEPGTLAMFGFGLVGIFLSRRSKV